MSHVHVPITMRSMQKNNAHERRADHDFEGCALELNVDLFFHETYSQCEIL